MARHNGTEQRALSAKLRALAAGNRGETITETLVALLIGGLALLMLAVVIAVTVRMLSTSEASMNAYYASSNTLATTSAADASGSVALKKGNDTIKTAADQSSEYDVSYLKGKVVGQDVVLYWKTASTSDEGSDG